MSEKGILSANVVAVQINVLCPECSTPLPSVPSGADLWLPGELQRRKRQLVMCKQCGRYVRIMPPKSARVDYDVR